MAIELREVQDFIARYKQNTELWAKINEMVQYIVDNANTDLDPVRNKYRNPAALDNETIKQIIVENGYGYIRDVMDTLNGFDFDVMISFVDLIGNLKGTRRGMELVLRLMGFDSIIKEWWQNDTREAEPWSYEIIVIMDTSFVVDVYNTLDKLKIFSENYVLAMIDNIDIRFSAAKFAEALPIMGGFHNASYRGTLVRRLA